VASQKLVIKGGGNYTANNNGIALNWYIINPIVGDIVEIYVYSEANANSTLYWWIYPENANIATPASGTVVIGEGGAGNNAISFVVDNDDYEFTVRVSPVDNQYDSANTGVETLVFNEAAPSFGDHHLHLTTGDLNETSIFLGTDNHNVRTTVDGGIEINTYLYPSGGGSGTWIFDNDGNLELPTGGVIGPYGMGWTGITNGNTGTPISISYLSNADGSELSSVGLSGGIEGGQVYISAGTANTSNQWIFGENGSLTFPDTTAQTTAYLEGEHVFEVNVGSTTYEPVTIGYNLLTIIGATGYTSSDAVSIILPQGRPGQKLVLLQLYSPATVTVNPGPFESILSVAIPAEFIYSAYDGAWIPLYGIAP
jgi:hypothetical protein